jgi:membrane fusion protein (multidrug efflux system)
MWVYFNVPESRYLEYVAVGEHQPEQVELVLANRRLFDQSGTISAIQADFNRETGNIAFRADFPNPDRVLRHGMTGNVLVHRTLKNAIVIPQRATFEILNKRYVFVVDAHDVVHRREIVVKHELADSFVIEPGLDKGDRIIVDGVGQVSDGAKVTYEFVSPGETPGFEAKRPE